ncbi:MAG: AAA family ATPase [Oribacterium sp.]|nr:AAA family ATPase [Oribacterium sp.]
MKLIYAYIKHYRNISEQEIYFSDKFLVKYDSTKSFPEALEINSVDCGNIRDIIYADSKLSNVHIIVGKTGAGKTNILQLIGMTEKERLDYSESTDSYFLLYEDGCSFVIEPFNIIVSDDVVSAHHRDDYLYRLPERLQSFFHLKDSMQMFRFKVDERGNPINASVVRPVELGKSLTYVFNGLDKNAFAKYPYLDERREGVDNSGNWMPRYVAEYHRTTLWNSCSFLKEYIYEFSEDSIKRKAALVIENQNWGDKVRQYLDEKLENHDYWTFIQRNRHDEELQYLGKKVKKHKQVSIKHQFIHDLWTDYALYLRKWISYIEMFPEEIPKDQLDSSGTTDVYQEYMDYYFEKEMEEDTGRKDKNIIDPTILPDFEDISILKRIEWLSMYIDRKGDGYPKGLLWQIFSDIKDIGSILSKLDDKYFASTRFSIPIVDMYSEKNKVLIEDLIERMEMYRPDDVGIFTEKLLPYHFDCISSGEYQFAKVFGGIEEYCVKLSLGENREVNKLDNKPNALCLLDEPETYMHPELCRTFMSRLDKVLKNRISDTDVQVIITTHSPLFLSDVLPSQITRLDVDDRGYCLVKNMTEKAYFGANIHTILSDGFFLDYTIGEYAREFLQQKMNWLNGLVDGDDLGESEQKQIQELEEIVRLIGDAVIRGSFEQKLRMLNGKTKL